MKTKNQRLLADLNKAFAQNDTDFILKNVTDDIKWTVLGDFSIQGITAFKNTLAEMGSSEPFDLKIEKIITHGKEAAVSGIMKSTNGTHFAFCDIYSFNGYKDAKIREITSYVIPVSSASE